MTPKDPDRLIKVAKAIQEKYGKEALVNVRASWSMPQEIAYIRQVAAFEKSRRARERKDDKIEVDGVLIPIKLLNVETDRACPRCNAYSFSKKDDLFMTRYECCEKCYIELYEGREEKWLKQIENKSKKSSEKR